MLKSLLKSTVVLMVCLAGANPGSAAESRASKGEAEKMVKKAVKAVKEKGTASYAEITAPSKTFVDRDLYIAVYDMNGKCLAHGQNPKQVGRDLIGFKDADGKEFVKERVELAKARSSFWQSYKFADPLTKETLAKEMYCEKSGQVIVCGGIYKQ